MGRGLGATQRMVLKAMRELEADAGGPQQGFRVWEVLKRVWHDDIEPARVAEDAERSLRETARKTALQEAMFKGDKAAECALKDLDRLDFLGQSIRHAFRDRRPYQRVRPKGANMESLNPSRCFALLEKRGLITRYNVAPGNGACVALTEKGRQTAASPASP